MTTECRTEPSLARFNELVPFQTQHAQNGIPQEVTEYVAANRVFPVVCPPGLIGRNALAPLRGLPGLTISIAQCAPGRGPVAHNHTGTLETFFCLDGQFDVMWGNKLEQKLTLEPGDLCSFPPGVYRTFRNLTDTDARIFAMIQGDNKMTDSIQFPRAVGEEIRQKYGENVMALLAGIKMNFQGGDFNEVTSAEMAQRMCRLSQSKAPPVDGATIYPMMSPDVGRAPVKAWPGLSVALVQAAAGGTSTDTVPEEHIQWIVNVADNPCEVVYGEEQVRLGRFDIVRIDPGITRTIRPADGQPIRVLLATQGKETISFDEILQ